MLLPNLIFSQQKMEFTTVKSNTGEVRISGIWEQLNKMDDSGQTYLKNSEGVIIAVAKNLKTSYPFVKKKKSAYENVKSFYKWDSDYRKANNFNTSTIKENSELEYIIWKYADDKMDNVFLFGSVKDNFINLLVYTNKWSEVEKVKFLEAIYEINK
jgi:C4-type Zn-finger protein